MPNGDIGKFIAKRGTKENKDKVFFHTAWAYSDLAGIVGECSFDVFDEITTGFGLKPGQEVEVCLSAECRRLDGDHFKVVELTINMEREP